MLWCHSGQAPEAKRTPGRAVCLRACAACVPCVVALTLPPRKRKQPQRPRASRPADTMERSVERRTRRADGGAQHGRQTGPPPAVPASAGLPLAAQHGAVDHRTGSPASALAVGTLLMTWWLVAAATSEDAFASGAMVPGLADRLLLLFGWTVGAGVPFLQRHPAPGLGCRLRLRRSRAMTHQRLGRGDRDRRRHGADLGRRPGGLVEGQQWPTHRSPAHRHHALAARAGARPGLGAARARRTGGRSA